MAYKEIEARLKISAIDRTQGALARIGDRLDRVGGRVDMVNRRTAAIGNAAQRTAGIVTRTLIPALAGIGAARIINGAAEAREALEYIAINADATSKEIEAAGDQVRKLTKDMSMPYEAGVAGLDVLIASGKSLEEAMAFLPEVLEFARATNSAVGDIANTSMKVSSAYGIPVEQIGEANDLMAWEGKAGQFETKDMAQYMPGIGTFAAGAGYEGMEGLLQTLAIAQTLREDAASSESVNTQMKALLPKIRAPQTISAFEKQDIDLLKELNEADAAGNFPVDAFIKVTEKAIGGSVDEGGDLKMLSQLFTEQDLLMAMTSLLTSKGRMQHFIDEGRDPNVKGTIERDLERILKLDAAKIDTAQNASSEAINKVGGMAAEPTAAAAERFVQAIEYSAAQYEHLQSLGMDSGEIRQWRMFNNILGGLWPTEEGVQAAYAGGYRGELYGEDIESLIEGYQSEEGGADLMPEGSFGFQRSGRNNGTLEQQRFDMFGTREQRNQNVLENLDRQPDGPSLIDRLMDLFDNDVGTGPAASARLKSREEAISQDVEDGSRTVGQAFTEGADDVRKAGSDAGGKVREGGDDVARALGEAADAIERAARQLTAGELRKRSRNRNSNSNPGKSMKPENNAPQGAYD